HRALHSFPTRRSSDLVLTVSVGVMSTHLLLRRARSTDPPDERRTYTVTEVADIVGISRSTAYECVRRGEIPSRRFGRRIVVLRQDRKSTRLNSSHVKM